MTKKIMSLFLALALMCSMTTAFAANTSGKQYYMDLQSMTEQEFKDSSVNIQLYFNGKDILLGRDGITGNKDNYYRLEHEEDLGVAVLFRYDPTGATVSQNTMNVTYVPIRRIAKALGLPISWNDETKNVVLDTPKGRIEFPVGATSITAPDGTTYEEQTYRFPNGDPINITSMRDGRVYVTARFISTFCMPNAKYLWKGSEKLTIMGTIEGTEEPEKTYGINENYMSIDESRILDFEAMPTLVALAEEMPSLELDYNLIHFSSESTLTHAWNGLLVSGSGRYGIDVLGYDALGDEAQWAVIDAMLTDTINDADRQSIMAVLKELSANISDGWTRKGLSPAGQAYFDSFPLKYTFNEVVLEFENPEYTSHMLRHFTITNK